MSDKIRQAEIDTIRIEAEDVELEAMPTLQVSYSSILGTRKSQQDSMGERFVGGRGIAVVCDGMGGLKGGATASKTAVDQILLDYHNNQPIPNIPKFLEDEARKADNAVFSLNDERGGPLDAGTTMVAVIIDDGKLYWLSVGDSKIYIVRNHEIVTVNRLHNYRLTMDKMLKGGAMTVQEYQAQEKKAEALISYLGMGNVSLMDINREPFILQDQDVIVLASDGLYRCLNDQDILRSIQDNMGDVMHTADALTALATRKASRGQDNTSVILIRYNKNWQEEE